MPNKQFNTIIWSIAVLASLVCVSLCLQIGDRDSDDRLEDLELLLASKESQVRALIDLNDHLKDLLCVEASRVAEARNKVDEHQRLQKEEIRDFLVDAIREVAVDPTLGCDMPVAILCDQFPACNARSAEFCFEDQAGVWCIENGWDTWRDERGVQHYLCPTCQEEE